MIAASITLALDAGFAKTQIRAGRLRYDGQPVFGAGKDGIAPASRGPWVTGLANVFYSDLYGRGISGDGRFGPVEAAEHGQSAAEFEASFDDVGRLGLAQSGWRIQSIEEGEIDLLRGGLTVSVPPDRLIRASHGPPMVGEGVGIVLPGYLRNLAPGFLTATGEAPFELDATDFIVRWYWNLKASVAARFLRAVRSEATGRRLPFQCKVLADPSAYRRCDAGVLYTRRSDLTKVLELVRAIYPEVSAELKPEAPLFTKWLAAGLGVAEDPAGDDSFGMYRCRSLASVVLSLAPVSYAGLPAAKESAVQQLSQSNWLLDAPHLTRSAGDVYSLLGAPVRPRKRAAPASIEQAVAGIANVLIEDAYRHAGRATWFSQAMAKGPLEKVSADIDLYGGLAGIGWFLSEFAAGSGSQPARSTAIAGLEQAFFLLDSKATAVGGGLYDGRIGLALAAVRCGQLLKCPSLLDRGRALILDQSRVPNDEDEANSDVISGDAGKLLGLLASETLPMAKIDAREGAGKLAARLISSARIHDRKARWNAGVVPRRRLIGYSHGPTGVGVALAMAAARLGHDTLRETAASAFRFEDAYFDFSKRNWRDLRSVRAGYSRAWCHGAPGVLLGRWIAAHSMAQHEVDPRGALASARSGLFDHLDPDHLGNQSDWTLCHGVGGLAEILKLVAVTGAERARANEVLYYGISRYSGSSQAWPTPGGVREPTLMCGLAGIGIALLRCAKPDIVSPVMFAALPS